MKTKSILFLFLLLNLFVNGWAEDRLLHVHECDVCLTRFYEIQEYRLCEKCYLKLEKDGRINLHPSRYCGSYCAHGNSEDEIYNCPYKDSPKEIIKEF